MMKRWTVRTNRGAFVVYALTEGAARRKIKRSTGIGVVSVEPRSYRPPRRPS